MQHRCERMRYHEVQQAEVERQRQLERQRESDWQRELEHQRNLSQESLDYIQQLRRHIIEESRQREQEKEQKK